MAQAKGGSCIRNARAPDNWGTLGCVVLSRTPPHARYILSAAHVIALNGLAQHGDSIEAYVPAEDRWMKIAEFERFVPFRDTPGVYQVCDAAIARVTNNDVVSGEIDRIGMPLGLATGLFQGKRLTFNGVGSEGVNESSVIHSSGNALEVIYERANDNYTLHFKDQILYGYNSGGVWQPGTKAMDSGALVLDRDNLAVGLHIAITPPEYSVSTSVCTPIQAVLDALDVELETGTDPAPVARDPDSVSERAIDQIDVPIRSLFEPHNPFGGVPWQLTSDGLVVAGALDRSSGRLVTVPNLWAQFGAMISYYATHYKVPVELIVATICTETSGKAQAIRLEPGYESDTTTPHRISVGLMQTLISTAREALGDPKIDRAMLLKPDISVMAGTAYIDRQRAATRLDPPQVACAYNAGRLAVNDGAANRWKMRQYPIGTGAHADRFTKWFNDCFAYFRSEPGQVPDAPSFFRMLNGL